MLLNTFCHFPGVGPKTEVTLWRSGATSWRAALDAAASPLPLLLRRLSSSVQESLAHYEKGDPGYFCERLAAAQQWRYFPEFRSSCAYVDIETTGMDARDQITTIALFDGRTVRHYVRGQNLDDFPRDLADYRMLVTYNGKCFDVPFLERCFGVQLTQAHIDLRYVLHSLDIRGGLKVCEQRLGVHRKGMEEMDGFMAVRLWHDYRRSKDLRVLETLLAYNVQDAVNLEALMVLAYNRKVLETPFAVSHTLPLAPPPRNPFQAHADVVRRFAWRG